MSYQDQRSSAFHPRGSLLRYSNQLCRPLRADGSNGRWGDEVDMDESVRSLRAASSRISSVLQKTKRTRERPPPPSRKKLDHGTGVTPTSRERQTANSVSLSAGPEGL